MHVPLISLRIIGPKGRAHLRSKQRTRELGAARERRHFYCSFTLIKNNNDMNKEVCTKLSDFYRVTASKQAGSNQYIS